MIYDAIQLGPFTIQYFLIVILVSFVVTYFFIDAFLNNSATKYFIRKHYWIVVFILLVSYKFSIVLFRPDLLLSNRWLFFTGGQNGIFLGLFISIVYLLWSSKKEDFSIKVCIKAISLLTASFMLVYQLIKIVVLSFA